jgi:hypothetical protein
MLASAGTGDFAIRQQAVSGLIDYQCHGHRGRRQPVGHDDQIWRRAAVEAVTRSSSCS